jgi:hypothetical protein
MHVHCVSARHDQRRSPGAPFLLNARDLSDHLRAVGLAAGCSEFARRGRFIFGAGPRSGDHCQSLTDANLARQRFNLHGMSDSSLARIARVVTGSDIQFDRPARPIASISANRPSRRRLTRTDRSSQPFLASACPPLDLEFGWRRRRARIRWHPWKPRRRAFRWRGPHTFLRALQQTGCRPRHLTARILRAASFFCPLQRACRRELISYFSRLSLPLKMLKVSGIGSLLILSIFLDF